MTPQESIYKVFDASQRRYITFHDPKALPRGDTVIQMWWAKSLGRYVTLPGQSLHFVEADGSLRLIAD